MHTIQQLRHTLSFLPLEKNENLKILMSMDVLCTTHMQFSLTNCCCSFRSVVFPALSILSYLICGIFNIIIWHTASRKDRDEEQPSAFPSSLRVWAAKYKSRHLRPPNCKWHTVGLITWQVDIIPRRYDGEELAVVERQAGQGVPLVVLRVEASDGCQRALVHADDLTPPHQHDHLSDTCGDERRNKHLDIHRNNLLKATHRTRLHCEMDWAARLLVQAGCLML